MRLANRVVFITGASRGIGRACALGCARAGADVVIAAKTDGAPDPRLPGTIHEVAGEVEALGRRALAIKLDVRDADACEAAVERAAAHFGRIDGLINNAGALFFADVAETPARRFDLVMDVNVRASFVLSRAVLPHMLKNRRGHIVMMSPPVDTAAVAHHAAYAVSKFGMTLVAQAIAEETRGTNVTAHSLWPATAVESYATRNFGLGDPSQWRRPEIVADALVALLSREPSSPHFSTARAWTDEEVLRAEGVTDFSRYQCVPGAEPPALPFSALVHDPARG